MWDLPIPPNFPKFTKMMQTAQFPSAAVKFYFQLGAIIYTINT